VDIEIKVPSLGESESEATLVVWHKQAGESVAEDDVLAEIESDKITMEVTAYVSGTLKEVRKHDGDTVEPGEVIGLIEQAEAGRNPVQADEKKTKAKAEAAKPKSEVEEQKPVQKAHAVKDVPEQERENRPSLVTAERHEQRVPMSGLRKTIARRLKQAQQTAAILTTFNEVNMQPVMDLRSRYRDAFKAQHGVGLGFMSFFVRACAQALARFPAVNACVEGEEIVYRNYQDIGIAVSTERGLVVPVLRDAGAISMAAIEQGIADYAEKARSGALLPDDLKGGTFSITNGGVFGSLLSTPILNPPQSAILGMHTIQQRPVAENGQVVIRPMMYLALSYDHRLIDGREAVQFLSSVKEALEYQGRSQLDL